MLKLSFKGLAFIFILSSLLVGCNKGEFISCEKEVYLKKIEVAVSPALQQIHFGDTIWFRGEFETTGNVDRPANNEFDYTSAVVDMKGTFTGIDIAPLRLLFVENTLEQQTNAQFAGQSFTFIESSAMINARLENQPIDAIGKYLHLEPTANLISFRFGLVAREVGNFAIYLNNTNIDRCGAPESLPFILQLQPEMGLALSNNFLFDELNISDVGLIVESNFGVSSFGIEDPKSELSIIAFKVLPREN